MPTAQTIDVKYINPFISSAINAIETLTGVKPVLGRPFIKSPTAEMKYDVSGAIGLSGRIQGLISMNFTEEVICPLVAKMLGTDIARIDGQVCDAVGELANITVGSAKEAMDEMKISFKISLPMVIAGRYQSHNCPLGVPCIVVPFKTDYGEFTIEVWLKSN